jgi:hypothetical protein
MILACFSEGDWLLCEICESARVGDDDDEWDMRRASMPAANLVPAILRRLQLDIRKAAPMVECLRSPQSPWAAKSSRLKIANA